MEGTSVGCGPKMTGGRLRRALLPLSLLSLLLLFIHACVPKPITNLRAVSVSRVPASSLPLTDDLRGTLVKRGEAVWKIALSGDANWIHEVQQHELNSYAVVRRCDQHDQNVLALGPYVGAVPITYYGDGFESFRPGSRTVRYDIYLPQTGRYRSEADFNAPMPSYDLGEQQMTLCIRIAGGAMHGAYNTSNEVRVRVGA
jgi:hypothetical protein